MIIVSLIILGVIVLSIGAVGIGYLIIKFIDYKDVQNLARIRLPFKKIKEFYNLAPEKYNISFFDTPGIFTYTPGIRMRYAREHIMCNSYIGYLRSLRFVRQIKHNKINVENNTHVKHYLQYVLEDAKLYKQKHENK